MRSTLQKFDGRAQDYVVGRPVYAQEFVEALFRDYGFSSDSVIADIGLVPENLQDSCWNAGVLCMV
ncbi:hypothetical protein ACI3DN_16805 [Sellimonas catena]|uniref:hypothetical protein n=1 Tax=Sellimonas catena TaxID=2994035 RepID=UPI00386B6C1D